MHKLIKLEEDDVILRNKGFCFGAKVTHKDLNDPEIYGKIINCDDDNIEIIWNNNFITNENSNDLKIIPHKQKNIIIEQIIKTIEV